MEPKFQTSFIPKRPIVSSQGSAVSVVRSTNIFSTIATVVFLVTIMTSLGLFAYKKVLISQITEANKQVITAKSAFQPEKTNELIDANSRIMVANNLLQKHVVVSKLLLLLQELTLKKVQFNDFVYANQNNALTLSMRGQVQTYNALAEQDQIFNNSEFIKDPKFSDFNLGDNGYIAVNFSANIDPDLLSYKKAIESLPLNQ